MSKLYLINAIYLVSASHSNILCKKEFYNQKSLPSSRSQSEIRRLKNLCVHNQLDFKNNFVSTKNGDNVLYMLVNDICFMMVVN